MQNKGFYEFGRHSIDVSQRVLLRDGKIVHLTPKAFDILLLLVQNHGRIVDKDTLMREVWPDSFVEEGNLAFNINTLRNVLDKDEPENPCIETVRKRGYRFVSDVRRVDAPYPQEALPVGNEQGQETPDVWRGLHAQSNQRESFSNLLDLAQQYRAWLLRAGIFVVIAAAFDITLINRGVVLPKDLALVALATASLYIHVRVSRRGTRPDGAAAQASAFRGLLPFERSDKDRFYGRDIDAAAVVDLITHSQFRSGVLYGDSGCGKTSLIKAGLLPGLEAKGYVVIYCRSYRDPVQALMEECRKRSGVARHNDEPPAQYLRRVIQESRLELVIICDQFEEFFVNFRTKRRRATFVKLVAACHKYNDSPVKFLFSIRSDLLYLITSAFDDYIPDTLVSSRRYHLCHFDEDQAAEIIEKSTRQANWQFEPGLSRRVAHDLAVDGTVLPSELQMVCEQLQNRRIFSLEEYRRVGGKEQLVFTYLESVIQMAGDRETALLLLRSLISGENTRLTLRLSEIKERLRRNPRVIERILTLFIKSRIIREIQDEEPWRYELVHDYLVDKVNKVTGRVLDSTQRANRMFHQYLSNYLEDERTRIPVRHLWFIRRYSDLERGERGRRLLKKSFRWALVKTTGLTLLLAAGVIGGAAVLSVNEEWKEVHLADGHDMKVRCAVFSPDGRLLVSVAEDAKIIVWDFTRRERLATIEEHKGPVWSVAFSPDGKFFATASADVTVIVWDAKRFSKVAVLPGCRAVADTIAFSPDGKFLITLADGDRKNVWEVGRWQKAREIISEGPAGDIFLISPDSRCLISHYWKAWDLTTARLIADTINPVWTWGALSPEGTRLATVDQEGSVAFWDVGKLWSTGRRRLLARYPCHRDRGRAIAYSPDGRTVATGGENIALWDPISQTKQLYFVTTSIVTSLTFSPDGRWLISCHADGDIQVWDVVEREQFASLKGHSAPVRAVDFSPDGKLLASASEDRSVIVWNTETDKKDAVLIGHNTRVTAVAFSPVEGWLGSGDLHGNVFLWDLARHEPRLRITPGQRPGHDFNHSIAISYDDRWVATSFGVYGSKDGKSVLDFLGGGDSQFPEIYAVSFSPDGRWLACVTARGQVLLWEVSTWSLAYSLKQAENRHLVTVDFSPDSRHIVTGEDEGAVRLWEVDPLREVGIIDRHSAPVETVSFYRKGHKIASSGDDNVIAICDMDGRRQTTGIGSHTASVLAVDFSPDGRRLASGERDKSVRVYTRHRKLWGYNLD